MNCTKATFAEDSKEEGSFSKLEIQELSFSNLVVLQEKSFSKLSLQESFGSPHWVERNLNACTACGSHTCVCFETISSSLNKSQDLEKSLNLSHICSFDASFNDVKKIGGKDEMKQLRGKHNNAKKKSGRSVKALPKPGKAPRVKLNDFLESKDETPIDLGLSFLQDSYCTTWLSEHTKSCKSCGSHNCVCFESIPDCLSSDKSQKLDKSLNLSQSGKSRFNMSFTGKAPKAKLAMFLEAKTENQKDTNDDDDDDGLSFLQDSYCTTWLAEHTKSCKRCKSHVCKCSEEIVQTD